MQIIVNDLLVHYELNGSGKTILLLHGWGDSLRGMDTLSKELSLKYQVLAINLPGFGGSQAPAVAWDLNAYADFVASMLQKLNLQCYAMIGHSNGGAILIKGLSEKKLGAEKLILLASAGIRNGRSTRNNVLLLISKSGKIMTSPLSFKTKRLLRQKLYQKVGSDMLVNENLKETFKKIVNDDVRLAATSIKIPTLIIYGDLDKSTPLAYGEIFQKSIKQSKLEIIVGAGHFVHQEKSVEVLKLIESFL